jgi:carbonic anhydrase
MRKILDGLAKFQNEVHKKNRNLFAKLASSQNPHAMLIACADSRVVPEFLTQSRPGDLFVSRNAGNIVPPTGRYVGGITAGVEYAVEILHVKDIVICGHSDCGAMKGVLAPEKVAHLKFVSSWLQYAREAVDAVRRESPKLKGKALLDAVIERNVVVQLEHLSLHPCVKDRLRSGKLRIHGWVYDIAAGRVRIYDPWCREFVPFEKEQMLGAEA